MRCGRAGSGGLPQAICSPLAVASTRSAASTAQTVAPRRDGRRGGTGVAACWERAGRASSSVIRASSAEHVGEHLNGNDHDEDFEDDDGDVGVGIESAPLVKEAADSARANDAEDRGDPHVELKCVQPLVGEQGPDLGERGGAVDLELRAARGPARLHVAVIGGINGLGDELHNDANVEQNERRHAGQRPDTEHRDKNGCVHEIRHRADHVDNGAHGPARPRVRVRRSGGPQRDGHGDRGGNYRANECHLQRF